ncbi:NADPH oxidase 5 [Portunus trituberculatus]|uniref:NADPH oxidase 5 n=1 Tax=Portunus trituberculatus TaxID=210409 RepID=A0A5B7GMR3_PORTR|nr:NADPH oxidase 5 [Portunus trituberculatus]
MRENTTHTNTHHGNSHKTRNKHTNRGIKRANTVPNNTTRKKQQEEHSETYRYSGRKEIIEIKEEAEGESKDGSGESEGERRAVARCSSGNENRALKNCYCCRHKTRTLIHMSSCSSCMPRLPACPRTGFTRENLEWLEQMFRQALGHKQELSFDDFKKIVHSRNSFFAERVFQIFDRDNSGTVSLSEFLDAMHQFAGKSPNDKIKFLFRVYDLDGERERERDLK